MKDKPVVIEHIYNAPVERVWEALTDLEQMRQWYFPTLVEFEPEIGFETVFDVEQGDKVFVHIWKVTEVTRYRKISYEWKFEGYPGDSFVSFELLPNGDQTKVILTHAGIGAFRGDLHPELSKPNFEQGWKHLIGSALKEFVEQDTE